MSHRFSKYHGIGNDFLVVETNSPSKIAVEEGVALCDRHFGVGGDGVLVVSPAQTEGAKATMTVINSDGSTPEMCGNGLRCVALHLARRDNIHQGEFLVDTGAGPLLCEVSIDDTTGDIGTDIGLGTHLGQHQESFEGQDFVFERISTGNPHAICFRPQITEEALDRLGPLVSGKMPEGANVEIATIKSNTEIEVMVWERGVGRTLACGTGAAATVIAAARLGHVAFDTPVTVHLPGGPLVIRVTQEQRAHLRGPAQLVYSGLTA